MAQTTTLLDVFVDEVRDLFDAEKQLVTALPKMAEGTSNAALRSAIERHLQETRHQVERLRQVFDLLAEDPKGEHCAGIAGIIEEGTDALEVDDAPGSVTDACILASAQRAEHYEIAAYGTAVAWADALGLEDVASVLRETLDEEKAANETLTGLAGAGINAAAVEGVSGGQGDVPPVAAAVRVSSSSRVPARKARRR